MIKKSCTDIIFLSVSHHSEEYLKLNNERLKAKRWIVNCDNYDENWYKKFSGLEVLYYTPLDIPETPGQFISTASYRHAARLNQLVRLENLHTRFVCILDPDFYLITKPEEVIDEMIQYNLGFHGAPYFPVTGRKKIYDVPAAFCLFIDQAHYNIKGLDFTPQGVLEDGTIADTGYNLYKEMKDGDTASYMCATPHSSAKGDGELYYHNDKPFGLHYRSKIHLRKGLEKQVKINDDIIKLKKLLRDLEDKRA